MLVAGFASSFNEFFEQRTVFALGALTLDGDLDAEYAGQGKVMTTFAAPKAEANAITLDRYRLVVAGWAGSDSESDWAIARYLVGEPPTYTVNVSLTGAGSGRVTGNGIDCPGDCEQTYFDDQAVQLTAAAGAGSTFAGWGEVCSGTTTCTLDVTGDLAVSADFAIVPAPPVGGPPAAAPSSACIAAKAMLDAATVRVSAATGTVARDRRAATRASADVRRAERKVRRAQDGPPKALKRAQWALGSERRQHERAKRALAGARKRLARDRTQRRQAERTVAQTC